MSIARSQSSPPERYVIMVDGPGPLVIGRFDTRDAAYTYANDLLTLVITRVLTLRAPIEY